MSRLLFGLFFFCGPNHDPFTHWLSCYPSTMVTPSLFVSTRYSTYTIFSLWWFFTLYNLYSPVEALYSQYNIRIQLKRQFSLFKSSSSLPYSLQLEVSYHWLPVVNNQLLFHILPLSVFSSGKGRQGRSSKYSSIIPHDHHWGLADGPMAIGFPHRPFARKFLLWFAFSTIVSTPQPNYSSTVYVSIIRSRRSVDLAHEMLFY